MKRKNMVALGMAIMMSAASVFPSMAAVQDAAVGQEFEMPAYNNGQYPIKNKVELITLEQALYNDWAEAMSIAIQNVQSRVTEGYEVIAFRSEDEPINKGIKMSFMMDGQAVSIGEYHRFDHTGYIARENALTEADYEYARHQITITSGYPLSVIIDGVVYDKGWYIPVTGNGNVDRDVILIVPTGHNITVKFRSADVSKAIMYNGLPLGFRGVDENMGVNVQLRGTTQTSTQPQSSGATPEWRQDAKGWWVQRPDGSYLQNEWFLSNGLWYYMGADGYMLTNTTTPDGYVVNADGVRVE